MSDVDEYIDGHGVHRIRTDEEYICWGDIIVLHSHEGGGYVNGGAFVSNIVSSPSSVCNNMMAP